MVVGGWQLEIPGLTPIGGIAPPGATRSQAEQRARRLVQGSGREAWKVERTPGSATEREIKGFRGRGQGNEAERHST